MSDNAMGAVMWRGDWSSLTDAVCAGDGHLEVWDQTIGCPACGQNLWFLPMTPEQWPAWSEDRPASDNWERRGDRNHNPYDVYVRLFDRRHPTRMVDAEDTEQPAAAIHGQVLCICRSAPDSLPIVRDERIWFPDMPTMAGVPPLTDFGPHSHEDAAVNPNGPADVEAARKVIDQPRFTPGMRVLVKLRHTETGGRGEVRHYEQVRLGTVVARGPDEPHVLVDVPGNGRIGVRVADVEDAMSEGRP